MTPLLIIAVVVGWIACGLIGGALASEKGRGSDGLLLGFLFGPIGIVIALLLPPKAVAHKQGTKHCPYCATAIDVSEMKCPNCRRSQPPRPTNADWEKTVAARDDVEKWAKEEKSDDAS
jgi:hypothetical protein